MESVLGLPLPTLAIDYTRSCESDFDHKLETYSLISGVPARDLQNTKKTSRNLKWPIRKENDAQHRLVLQSGENHMYSSRIAPIQEHALPYSKLRGDDSSAEYRTSPK